MKIGDEVLYTLEYGPCQGQQRPAKVVHVYPDTSTVDLCVFTRGHADGYPTASTALGVVPGSQTGNYQVYSA